MTTFAEIVGYLIIALAAAAIAALAIALLIGAWGHAMREFQSAVAAKTRSELALSIKSSAYWFSESDHAYHALIILADRIQTYGGPGSICDWRNEWRKSVEPATP